MKTVLLLGAAAFQVPPIRYARLKGYRVLTCDNRPDNPGHGLAHESFNISTIDRAAVLQLAKRQGIDGILTFGSDVSAPTAAYVAEEMGLPGNPLQTVVTMTHKPSFRSFLRQRGLQNTSCRVFHGSQRQEALDVLKGWAGPIVVKPTDSSGSKGVAVVRKDTDAEPALLRAFKASLSDSVILEPFVMSRGPQICGDGYFQDGRIVFLALGDGLYYPQPEYPAPYGECFPSTHDDKFLARVRNSLETILRSVGFRQGPFNLDVLRQRDDQPFVVEIGPRCGGNFLPAAILLHAGVDLAGAAVEGCLDPQFRLSLPAEPKPRSWVACYMVHQLRNGILGQVRYAAAIRPHLVAEHPYLRPGSPVQAFTSANHAVGNIVLRFESAAQMASKMARIRDYCRVDLG